MSTNRYTITGYGVLELNRVSFPITGRVVADVPLNSAFNTATPAENGMILAIDYAKNLVSLPASGSTVFGLHCSTEKEYDPNNTGLNTFKLVANSANTTYQSRVQGYYPRLGILSVGEKFTTNTICYDTNDFANDAEVLAAVTNCATTPVYGFTNICGAIKVTTNAPSAEKIALQVIEKTTIPDGNFGLKFVVITAQ
jgi:hypothetical protein